MKLRIIEKKIRLTDLAKRVGLRSASVRFHLLNGSGLGVGAEKLGFGITDDFYIPVESVKVWLTYMLSNSKKVNYETITEIQKELNG